MRLLQNLGKWISFLLFVEKVHIMNHPLSILTDGAIQNSPVYWTNILLN